MKKYILSLFLILTFILPVSANESLEDSLDMAYIFYQSGDFDAARAYINAILEVNPEHYGANCLLIKITPPDGYMDKKALTSQLVIRPRDTKTTSSASDEKNKQGQEFYNKKEFSDAEACFLEAIKISPKNFYALNNLGLMYQKLGNYKKAESNYKKAISANKNFTVAYDNLAQMYIQTGNLLKAKTCLLKAQSINKQDYCTKYLLGLVYKLEGNYKTAVNLFNEVEQMSPNFSLNLLQLADTYFLMGDYSWSNSTVEKYIELCPKDDFGYYLLYRNYLLKKEYCVARGYLIKAMKINNCIDYRIFLGDLESLAENPQGAVDALKSLPEKNGEILNEIGLNYLKLEEYDKALEYFKEASVTDNARIIYFYNIALVYKKLEDMENYNKLIKAIESTQPMIYQDYIDLSAIYLDCQGKNSAIEIIDVGIRNFPKYRPLYEAKLKIYTLTSDKNGIQQTTKDIKKVFKE